MNTVSSIITQTVVPQFQEFVKITEEKFSAIMKPEVQPAVPTNNQNIWFQQGVKAIEAKMSIYKNGYQYCLRPYLNLLVPVAIQSFCPNSISNMCCGKDEPVFTNEIGAAVLNQVMLYVQQNYQYSLSTAEQFLVSDMALSIFEYDTESIIKAGKQLMNEFGIIVKNPNLGKKL